MNRKYTTQQYFEAVQKIRRVFPTAAITTDIIVGFCGETDEEFDVTRKFVEKVNFSDIHVFPYSPREGTVSAQWEDTDGNVKTQRATTLNEIKQQLKNNFALSFCNTVQEILCERKRNGLWEGYTKEYLRVYFTGKAKVGDVVKVKVMEPYLDGAKGEVLN